MNYRAFISYASADRDVASRVERALERYRLPRPLRGSDRGFGPIPKRLTPIFRDRSDADASGSLATALSTALERSEALVVLCSPRSAASRWVNEEIRAFKKLGRGHRIFALLVGGVPRRFDAALAVDGAFPPALFERTDTGGVVVVDDSAEPLAADISQAGDGFEMATLKIVGGITGVPLTELTQSHFEAERRERRIIRAVAATMFTLAVAAGIAALAAYFAADAARQRLSAAIEMAARRVDDGARFGDEYGVPIEVTRQLLTGAERDFASLIGNANEGAPVLQMQRGRLLTLFSRLYRATGDTAASLERAQQASATLADVPTTRQWRRPDTWLSTLPDAAALTGERLGAIEALGIATGDAEGDAVNALALFERGRADAAAAGRFDFVARFWSLIGEMRYATGDLAGATTAQDAALAALQTRLGSGLTDPAERAAALSDRAELLLEREQPKQALADQTEVVAVAEAAARATPNDAVARQTLAHALTRQADMQYAVSGSWDASIAGLERAVQLLDAAAVADPARIDLARDLSVGLERLGDVMLQTGNVARAGQLFDRLISLRRDRLARDPQNSEAQRDLAVGLERRGDLRLAQQRALAALEAFDEARALRTGNVEGGGSATAVLTRDLAVLWFKTASARQAANRADWKQAYEAAIAMMEPLLKVPTTPPGWLRDVAVFRFSFGEALARRGQRAEARRHWAAALELIERQLAVSPDDPRLAGDRAQLLTRLK